ncbi:hypothetical protein TeGR_g2317 [Tetraparma gracilis]|uniref:C3H1-type domain-containing protein n=1 Tax=Tetraparma gracilis TaxID=2962635 RepID=A0ABQ6MQQ7_9STRA|nr:hypothetical protein TeGR_g2317 [Tetraparma gracilis]
MSSTLSSLLPTLPDAHACIATLLASGAVTWAQLEDAASSSVPAPGTSEMSKAVVYMGGKREFMDKEVKHVTLADGVTEIKRHAFENSKGLTNLSFLKDSAITTVGQQAFRRSWITILLGMERVKRVGGNAFYGCKYLCSIEGLGCEEMGTGCFAECTLLQSMKGWPASMTAIPVGTFRNCTGMATVDCNLSHVTSIGANAFAGCTSLLPPSLSNEGAAPAAVLAHLKSKSFLEIPAGAAPEEFLSAARAAEDALQAETSRIRAAQIRRLESPRGGVMGGEGEVFGQQQQTRRPSSRQMRGARAVESRILYKTRLCQTWIEHGSCPYKKKCRFAHGVGDLAAGSSPPPPALLCLPYAYAQARGDESLKKSVAPP